MSKSIGHYRAEPVGTEKYHLGESPFWDPRTRTCSFVDITAGIFYRMDAAGRITSHDFGQMVGAVVPAAEPGAYVAAGTDGLYLLEGEKHRKICGLTDYYESFQRSNDAKADPAGRLFFGSSVWKEGCGNSGNLFVYDGGVIRTQVKNTKISNGMAWSADRKHFYFSDSLEYGVFVFDYDLSTGEITNRRELFHAQDGVTDGLCIDAQDRLWVAYWGGHRVECRSGETGELLAVVDVPAKQVSSCCFYGEALDRLLITSSGDGVDGPLDGCIFTCRVDAKGCDPDYAVIP